MKKKGFTLIELLVVIAIIGILAGIIIVNVNSARVKSRDSRRMEDLNSVRQAIEMYNDTNSSYPATGGAWRNSTSIYADGWVPGVVPNFISVLPKDPINNYVGTVLHAYYFFSDGNNYKLMVVNPESSQYEDYAENDGGSRQNCPDPEGGIQECAYELFTPDGGRNL